MARQCHGCRHIQYVLTEFEFVVRSNSKMDADGFDRYVFKRDEGIRPGSARKIASAPTQVKVDTRRVGRHRSLQRSVPLMPGASTVARAPICVRAVHEMP